MKSGDLSTASSQLFDALKVLRLRWAEAAALWTDQPRRVFEEQHVAPIEPQVLLVLERMNRLSQMMHQARHDCS
jgi:hypothetical protein